jgi:PAS domain S-box-containing protein
VETRIVDAVGPALLDAVRAAGIGIVIAVVDAGGPRTIFVNHVTCALLGLTSDAILARSMFEFVAEKDRARVAESYARRIHGEHVASRLEFDLVDDRGTDVPVAAGVCLAVVAGMQVEVVLLTDMRARTAAAAQLRASEARFRDLVEAAPDGIVISRRGQILYANRAGGVLLGTPPEALVGRSLGEYLPPEDMVRMRERVAALATGERFPPSTYTAVRPDGSSILAEIASIVTEHDGAPAVLAFARDVTARSNLQAGLERAERLAAVGRLAAGMAHEINNPLAFISLNAEALERKLDGILPQGAERDEVMGLLSQLVRGSERVAGIVRDLKSFSREGEGEAEYGPLALEPVLASAIRMVEHEIAPRGRLVRRRSESVGASIRVHGDPRRLEQVFVNLLVNAAQALPEGGRGTIGIRESATAREVTIAVEDDGAGIAPEHLGRVFDPFFTTKPVGVGTGLGLSICHGIVSAFGGSMSIESELGRGTTVRVELARAEDAPAPESARTPPTVTKTPIPRRARVLIVEDQEALAVTLSRLLASQHDVSIALRVADATELLRSPERTFDLVLCDMLMPDGTGIDVFENACRARPDIAGRFVFMTGGAFTTDIAEFLDRVPNARLEKPFAISELEEIIARVIG